MFSLAPQGAASRQSCTFLLLRVVVWHLPRRRLPVVVLVVLVVWRRLPQVPLHLVPRLVVAQCQVLVAAVVVVVPVTAPLPLLQLLVVVVLVVWGPLLVWLPLPLVRPVVLAVAVAHCRVLVVGVAVVRTPPA